MKRRLFVFLLMISFALFSGCSHPVTDRGEQKENTIGSGWMDYYILRACLADEVSISAHFQTQSWGGPHLIIHFTGKELNSDDLAYLRKAVGDVSKICPHGDFEPTPCFITNKIRSIEVISTNDFNDIPAGNSLASKLTFLSGAVLPSIVNKSYDIETDPETDKYFWSVYYISPSCTPLIAPLFEINPDDLYLLDSRRTFIFFNELPEVKEHTFTVTFKGEDFCFSDRISVNFGEIKY